MIVCCCGYIVATCSGVWLGLVAGYTVITVLAGGSVVKSDWRQLAERAQRAATSADPTTAVAYDST